MNLTLPKTVEINGECYDIRYDFRVILEIIAMLNDPDLENEDKAEALLTMFYVNPEQLTDTRKAVDQCFRFIDCNSTRKAKRGPKLVDWEQDFDYIVAPVNRVLGYESRSVEYDQEANTGGVHWWTFLSAYMEIGNDSLFSQIVSIREKQAYHKKLEKGEREWARRNADLVALQQRFSESENALFDEWTKGVKQNGG